MSGSYLKVKLVDEFGNELDEITFTKEDVDGAVKFAGTIMGYIPKKMFGNKLDILPITTTALINGLGGVLVWKIKKEVYEKEIQPLITKIKG